MKFINYAICILLLVFAYDLESNPINKVTYALWDKPDVDISYTCLLYTSPSPRDKRQSRMPSSA